MAAHARKSPVRPTHDSQHAAGRPPRVVLGRMPVVVPCHPVRTPFLHVAPHVVQAKVVGRIGTDLGDLQPGGAVGTHVEPGAIRGFARRLGKRRRAPGAAGVFPLGFAGQAVTSSGGLFGRQRKDGRKTLRHRPTRLAQPGSSTCLRRELGPGRRRRSSANWGWRPLRLRIAFASLRRHKEEALGDSHAVGGASGGTPETGSSRSSPASGRPMINSPAGIRTSFMPTEAVIDSTPAGAGSAGSGGRGGPLLDGALRGCATITCSIPM